MAYSSSPGTPVPTRSSRRGWWRSIHSTSPGRRRPCMPRSRCPKRTAVLAPGRSATTSGNTTWSSGSSCSWPIWTGYPRLPSYDRPAMGELSHVDESGGVRMVYVGGKPPSRRRAVAAASVRMAPETAERLRGLPKGDALVTAQLAGVMAAKRTAELIPLCHQLPLSHVDVLVETREGGVEIVATVETTAQTGVEMEALTGAAVAALTVYDMAKAVDSELEITAVTLVEKTKAPVS